MPGTVGWLFVFDGQSNQILRIYHIMPYITPNERTTTHVGKALHITVSAEIKHIRSKRISFHVKVCLTSPDTTCKGEDGVLLCAWQGSTHVSTHHGSPAWGAAGTKKEASQRVAALEGLEPDCVTKRPALLCAWKTK